MAFRWKTPDLNTAVVDPQGVQAYQQQQAMGNTAQALNGANAMRGYQPNVQPNYRGMMPSQATQATNAQLAEQNYNQFMQEDASLQAKRQQLAQLKEKLAEIDTQIASVEAGGADEEKAIAAKLAEIGDTSLYQGILAREQGNAERQKANASGIDNMLFEADKLSWGLNSKSDEERGIVKQNIQAVLDRAKQVAEQTGTPLPPKYSELERKLQDSDKASLAYESERRRANDLWLKARNKTLENADIQEMEDYIKSNPNSEIAGQYRQLIEQYQGKTKESRASASKRKADAQSAAKVLMDLSLDEQLRRWSNMSASERKLLNDHGYIMDPKQGITSKDGI